MVYFVIKVLLWAFCPFWWIWLRAVAGVERCTLQQVGIVHLIGPVHTHNLGLACFLSFLSSFPFLFIEFSFSLQKLLQIPYLNLYCLWATSILKYRPLQIVSGLLTKLFTPILQRPQNNFMLYHVIWIAWLKLLREHIRHSYFVAIQLLGWLCLIPWSQFQYSFWESYCSFYPMYMLWKLVTQHV